MKYFTLICVALMFTFSSCNRMLLDVPTKQKIENAGISINQVQFYNSEEIVLSRQLKNEDLKVVSGKVRFENGKYIEEIKIRRNTPGVCDISDDKALRVSFEDGSGKSLVFLIDATRQGDYFKIGAKEWVMRNNSKIGKVEYQNKMYNLVRGRNSRLMINKSVLNKMKRNTRIAKGKKL